MPITLRLAAPQCGEACLSSSFPLNFREAMPPTFRVTRDTPAFYLTSVAKDRLPVFRTEAIANVACKALAEARTSGGFLIFAYMLMPDHLHVITDSKKESVDTLRFINGIKMAKP
jgi:REP element-mobilizing transposase RayT